MRSPARPCNLSVRLRLSHLDRLPAWPCRVGRCADGGGSRLQAGCLVDHPEGWQARSLPGFQAGVATAVQLNGAWDLLQAETNGSILAIRS